MNADKCATEHHYEGTVWAVPAFVALLGALLSGLAGYTAFEKLNRDNAERFDRTASAFANGLAFEANEAFEVIRAAGKFIEASGAPDRDAFRRFVTTDLHQRDSIKALEWIPRVSSTERVGFESAAQAAGYEEFRITERNQDGKLIPAGKRATHYPVFFIEPMSGNEPALGFDLGSEPTRRQALIDARDSRQLRATGPIRLVQGVSDRVGFLAIHPVFRSRAQDAPKPDFLGFTLGVFFADALIGSAIEKTRKAMGNWRTDFDFRVFDMSAAKERRLLFDSTKETDGRKGGMLHQRAEKILNIGGRVWRMEASSRDETVGGVQVLIPGVIFLGGIATTLLAATGLYFRARSMREALAAAAALHESRMRVELLMDSTAEGIFGQDLDGNCVFANAACVKILGYDSADELLGRNMHEAIHHSHANGDEYPKVTCPINRSLSENQGVHVDDEVFWRKDGKPFPVEYWSYPVREDGRVEGVVVTFLDITARKRAEAEIFTLNATLEERVKLRTKQLEAANTELEGFAYSVSHDLRAPLRSIDGYSQALVEDYEDALDGEAKTYLRFLREGAQEMGRLIDDILRLSRSTRGDMMVDEIDLSMLAYEVSRAIQEAEPGRSVDFRIEPELLANADQRLMKVVFENILGNAWKFTSKTENAVIAFGKENRDGENIFFVRDNGVGFDMEYVDKVFQPFHRLHSSKEFEGSGIGLSTVQRIVARHGGRVWAEGVPNEGATIYFSLEGMGDGE